MLSLTVIFINVLVAANGIPDTYEDPVSIVLIILNVLVLMIISGKIPAGKVGLQPCEPQTKNSKVFFFNTILLLDLTMELINSIIQFALECTILN